MEIRREDGFRFIIYSNDHRPAHVHIEKAGGKMKVDLGDAENPPRIASIQRMGNRDVRAAYRICCERQEEFLEKWGEIHG